MANNIVNKKKIETLLKKKETNIEDDVMQLEEQMIDTIKSKEGKTELIQRLQKKIDRMQERKIITEMKQEHYKQLFDYFNILILIFSAVLTVLEAIKNDVDVERADEPTKQFFKLGPLIIATGIGLITAIIKFKKFQETMENNTKAIEKSIFTTFRMKKLQEDLHFADKVKFLKILEIYKEEIFPLYNQAQEELEGTLQFTDIIKYSAQKKRLENGGNLKLLRLQKQENNFNDLYTDLEEHPNFKMATTKGSGSTTHTSLDLSNEGLDLLEPDNLNQVNIKKQSVSVI
jgi:hypothetical protein